jgi:hypothetical protein
VLGLDLDFGGRGEARYGRKLQIWDSKRCTSQEEQQAAALVAVVPPTEVPHDAAADEEVVPPAAHAGVERSQPARSSASTSRVPLLDPHRWRLTSRPAS